MIIKNIKEWIKATYITMDEYMNDDKLQKMIQEENLLGYKEELLNISVAPHELSKSEFEDYIRDYTSNPEEYDIDLDSNYGKALLWAIDNIDKAYDLIKKL